MGIGPRRCHDTVVWAYQRRQASYRLPVLDGGYSDPVQPWRPERLSDKQTEGAVLAAAHLRDAGLLPVFDLPTLRCMWRSGHHALVDELRGEVA